MVFLAVWGLVIFLSFVPTFLCACIPATPQSTCIFDDTQPWNNYYKGITPFVSGDSPTRHTIIESNTAPNLINKVVILIQIQGSNYGLSPDITGKYEFNVVESVSSISSTTYNITFLRDLQHAYARDFTKRYQLITARFCVDSVITGQPPLTPWNGETGGVISFLTKNLQADEESMKANGLGFRGGLAYDTTYSGPIPESANFFDASDMDFNALPLNGRKGEGVEGFPSGFLTGESMTNYPNGDGCAAGAIANAGGGGNRVRTGGGGGGNYGRGADGEVSDDNSVAGEGGRSLEYLYSGSARNTLTFGGGGGAGIPLVGENAGECSGGNGGGIVIIHCEELSGGEDFSIEADGESGPEDDCSGSYGGAGAGGSILFLVESVDLEINVSASGTETDDNGGGGGGGVVWRLPNVEADYNVEGGENADDGIVFITEGDPYLEGDLSVFPSEDIMCNLYNPPTFTATPTRTPTTSGTLTSSTTTTLTSTSSLTLTATSSTTPTATLSATSSPTLTASTTSTLTATVTPSTSTTLTASTTPTLTASTTTTETTTTSSTLTATPSATTSATGTSTHTLSATSSLTLTATTTTTLTATVTPSTSATLTASTTPTLTASTTTTLTSTTTPTLTASTTTTMTATPSKTTSVTGTSTRSLSTTSSPTLTASTTTTLTSTTTPTLTATPSMTNTFTATTTPTLTASSSTTTTTLTATITPSTTSTLTATMTPSNTAMMTSTSTKSLSLTAFPTQTATASTTITLTESSTDTPTPSPTPSNIQPNTTSGTTTATETLTASATVTAIPSISRSPTLTKTSSLSPTIFFQVVGPESSSEMEIPFPSEPEIVKPPIVMPSASVSRSLPNNPLSSSITVEGETVGTVNILGTTNGVTGVVTGPSELYDFDQSNVASSVVSVIAVGTLGEEVPFVGEAKICLEVKEKGKLGKGSCLGFLNEKKFPPVWECEDSCLEDSEDGVCGTTKHFTSFAVLFEGIGNNSDDPCASVGNGNYIFDYYWQDLILLGGTVLCVACCCFMLISVLILCPFGTRILYGSEGSRVRTVRQLQQTSRGKLPVHQPSII